MYFFQFGSFIFIIMIFHSHIKWVWVKEISHHLKTYKIYSFDSKQRTFISLKHQTRCRPWIYRVNIKERIKSLENKQTSWKINSIEQIKPNCVRFHFICAVRFVPFACYYIELNIDIIHMKNGTHNRIFIFRLCNVCVRARARSSRKYPKPLLDSSETTVR